MASRLWHHFSYRFRSYRAEATMGSLFSSLFGRGPRPTTRPPYRSRLNVECLEERIALASSLSISNAGPVAAGNVADLTVTAKDGSGNTDAGYRGTVRLDSSDSTALLANPLTVLPASYTFTSADNGVHTFEVLLHVAGSQTVKVTDTATSSLTSTGTVNVVPGAVKVFAFSGVTSAVTAGNSQGFTVTAQDAFANTVTDYTGTIHFSSDDSQAGLPHNYPFVAADNGVHAFSATLRTAGNRTVTAVDTLDASATGSAGISVNSAAATHIGLGIAASGVAGSALDVTVTAQDPFGNTDPSFTGTVHFGSADLGATLPADFTFGTSDQGQHTFPAGVVLRKAGTESVTVTTPTLQDGTNNVLVAPAPVSVLKVQPNFPTPAPAGTAGTVTVTAQDNFGNTVPTYQGQVHLGSSDLQVTAPPDYNFTAADNGVHQFPATVKTAGNQLFTATDASYANITGNGGVNIVPGPVAKFGVKGFSPTNPSGVIVQVTVTVLDLYGNVVPTYLGTVQFTSTDGQAVLPVNYNFTLIDQGIHIFPIVMTTGGGQIFSVSDTVTGFSGVVSGIVVLNPVPVIVGITPPAAVANGSPVTIVVTGTGFVITSVVQFNGAALTTTFVSGTELHAALPTGLIPGTGAVTVFNPQPGGGTSKPVAFPLADDIPNIPNGPAPINLINVAKAFARSGEHFLEFLAGAYKQFLNRAPDDSGLNFWLTGMQAGMFSDEQVEADFLGSQEYIGNHGGNNQNWVRGMYKDLLGRTPSDTEVQNWLNVLAAGTSTSAVALGFAASAEREAQRVRANYETYLDRAPTQTEVDQWVNSFVKGTTNEDMVGGFVGSPEYYQSTQKGDGNAAQWVDTAYHDVLFRPPSLQEINVWLGTFQ
jgi:hypothetical protein